MKGYKAFKKGMICHGKQYRENTVFEEDVAEICKRGMHFCKYPLDVLEYYPLVDEKGNISVFAEVEALGEAKTDDGKKYCTERLKIGNEITFAELVQASIDEGNVENGYGARIGSSGDDARIGSSGVCAQIGSSGDGAQIGSSGYGAQIGSSGDDAQIGSSGDDAQIGSIGECARIGSIGDGAQIGSSGYGAQIGSSGDDAQIGSSGNDAQIGSSGYSARIGSSGDGAQIGSSGYGAQIGSSGDDAQIGSSGDSARIGSSGDWAQIISEGKNSVVCCAGSDSCVKAKKGSWITLSEWGNNDEGEYVPKCVRTMQVDGETIKEDTFYRLKNGEFVEVED